MLTRFPVGMIKGTAACLAVALWLPTTTVVPAYAQDSVRVTIENASRYDIHQIHISRSTDTSWRRDLLGTRILASGGSFTLTAGEGTYDLKLVDEDGDVCTVKHIPLFENKSWRITDSWLVGCEFH